MPLPFDPFRLLLIAMAGMMNQQHRDVIDYLQEENRVLRQQLIPDSIDRAALTVNRPRCLRLIEIQRLSFWTLRVTGIRGRSAWDVNGYAVAQPGLNVHSNKRLFRRQIPIRLGWILRRPFSCAHTSSGRAAISSTSGTASISFERFTACI